MVSGGVEEADQQPGNVAVDVYGVIGRGYGIAAYGTDGWQRESNSDEG